MKYFCKIYSKINQAVYSSLPVYSSSFKALTTIVMRYFADKVKMPKIKKGHNWWSIFSEFNSKVIQVLYSSLQINSPSSKAQAPTVFEIFCWQGKNAQNYKGQ